MHGLFTLLALTGIGFHSAIAVAEPLLDPIPEIIELGDKQVKLTTIADGMVAPLHGTAPAGDTNRLFVADQVGLVYAVDLATGVKTLFLDVSDRIVINLGGYDERGLLGLAFHPDYATNGYFYTYTSEATDGEADFPWDNFTFGPHQSVITEWRVNNPLNSAELPDPAYEREIMRIDQPTGFHNAGALIFDLQGYMYIALGNGGPLNTGQDNTSILGSILRIIPHADYAPYGNHLPSANGQYLVPEDNPFLLDPDALDEIFAHGFRNPFRISIDPVHGDIYAGDVGNNDIEEVDLVIAGNNYGFAIKEGSFCFVGQGGQPDGSPGVADPSECADESVGLIDPLAEYDHDEGLAIIGGYVYWGNGNPDLYGRYVFGDYNGRLFYLDGATIRELDLVSPDSIGGLLLGMGRDANGEIYALVNDTGRTRGTSGRLLRIDAPTPVEKAADNMNDLMDDFYETQGIGPDGAAAYNGAMDKALAAAASGDTGELMYARRFLGAFISAVSWGRNRLGDPVVTDEQADALINAAKILLAELPAILESGLYTMQSGGVERSFWVQLPSDYNANDASKPLIVGFHGSFGSHRSWVGPDRRYTFSDVVGDDAIMVFPDALLLGAGGINWNFEYDFDYFANLIDKLDYRGLAYNRNELFVTGHSSGAGMANEVGCRFGDIVRAIAISSGSLISNQCIGSVAVIQSQGEADLAVPLNIGDVAHSFWVLYNGWDKSLSVPGVTPPCIDHSLLPLGAEKYPVQWCLHPGGHAWPAFASDAFWDFFSGLPDAEPTPEPPPGGGNDRVLAAADTTISFTLNYPEGMGTITGGAITLYPPDYCAGLFAAPSVFLNTAWSPGDAAPGSTITYENVPVTYFAFGPFATPADYQLQLSIYVQGGSQPIPTPGVDLIALEPINIPDTTTPLILGESLDVEFVPPFIGACPAATAVPQALDGRRAITPGEAAASMR